MASCSAIQCRVIGNLAYFSEKLRRRIALKQRFRPGGGIHPLFIATWLSQQQHKHFQSINLTNSHSWKTKNIGSGPTASPIWTFTISSCRAKPCPAWTSEWRHFAINPNCLTQIPEIQTGIHRPQCKPWSLGFPSVAVSQNFIIHFHVTLAFKQATQRF